ncbi:UDP-glucosyltransferase family protein [Sesbania bispinosa]|nr:UDP-glucosyltransferase family protein [Sesbania bispinosa]
MRAKKKRKKWLPKGFEERNGKKGMIIRGWAPQVLILGHPAVVGAAEWSSIGFGERENLVRRDSIEKAVRRLMDGGDEADQIRRRAQEFGEKARQAVQEGGSSHNNLTALIDDLKRLRDGKLLSMNS